MNSPAKAHEPTMEEILASIRRIISDDDPAAAKPSSVGAAVVAEPKPELRTDAHPQVGQDDVDAMFAEIDAPAAAKVADPLAPPPNFEDDLEVLELTEEMEERPIPAPQPATPPRPAPRPVAPAPSRPQTPSEDLLSAAVGEQVSNAFGTLAHTVLAGNAKTLDDIVREMLRPMLRAWLDDNLPPLVERLVRQEIERVARGGR